MRITQASFLRLNQVLHFPHQHIPIYQIIPSVKFSSAFYFSFTLLVPIQEQFQVISQISVPSEDTFYILICNPSYSKTKWISTKLIQNTFSSFQFEWPIKKPPKENCCSQVIFHLFSFL